MAHILLCVVYFSVLLALSGYGLHRLHLVILCYRHRRKIEKTIEAANALRLDEKDLPVVTIQLPLFNESTVATRLIEACSRMDYPTEKLEIQVLDDSTDETQAIVRSQVERLAALGHDIKYIHRVDRVGYKAGALDAGLKVCRGSLVAIFDADFIPQPDFVRSIVAHFADSDVGMVQTRWGHLNRDVSLLTRVQSLMLDGHHLVENRARFGSGFLFNFSGTGGMWRKDAILDAGGWEHDTLTEDLDLSYRAQMKGWRFVYRPDVVSPSELPEEVSAVRAQQYRWAKGTVQTARKLLGRVMRADLTLGQRIEACFHMTPHFAYPLLLSLSVLLLPALILMPATDNLTMVAVDLPLMIASSGSLAAFYMEAERAQGRSRLGALVRVPWIIALGTGLAPHLTKAVWDGMRNMAGEFVRTPKQGSNANRYKVRADLPWTEMGLSAFNLAAVVASIQTGHWFATPFAALFTAGYAYVAYKVTEEQTSRRRAAVTSTADEAVESEDPALSTSGERMLGGAVKARASVGDLAA